MAERPTGTPQGPPGPQANRSDPDLSSAYISHFGQTSGTPQQRGSNSFPPRTSPARGGSGTSQRGFTTPSPMRNPVGLSYSFESTGNTPSFLPTQGWTAPYTANTADSQQSAHPTGSAQAPFRSSFFQESIESNSGAMSEKTVLELTEGVSLTPSPDALFMRNASFTSPKVSLPKFSTSLSFHTWSKRVANALSTVVGVFTIVTALLQGDPMGAEPLLPQDNVIQCMHREEQYSMGTYSHREQKLNVALAAEFTRYIRMTTPAQLRELIDTRVKGLTIPHSNWTIYNNQLYGLLWKALPDDIRRRVEADMTVGE